MKKQNTLLLFIFFFTLPLISMKKNISVFKKAKPQYIPGTLVYPVKGYPIKNILYKQPEKNVIIDGTLIKAPKVKGYQIKNSDFTPIKEEKEYIPEAEYSETPTTKSRTGNKHSKQKKINLGFFKAKAQNIKRQYNDQRVHNYSTQTNKSEREMTSVFRRKLLIAKKDGGDKALSTEYRQLAKKYHSDITKESEIAMKILNDVKEEVDNISQKDIDKYLNPQRRTPLRSSRKRNINDYYDTDNISDYLRSQVEYLKRKKEEEEEDIRSGAIIQEAPLNKEELEVRDSILEYINKQEEVRADRRKKGLESTPVDLYAYDVTLADGTIIYINRYALDDDFIRGKYIVGYEEPSKRYARKIYRLQQERLSKDFTNNILFKDAVYDRLVGGLAALYGRTRGSLLANDGRFDDLRMAQAENSIEIENMIKDQLKDYEEYVKTCSYNGANHIDGASITFFTGANSKCKELYEKTPRGFVNGYYKTANNDFAAIYDLFCNEYVVGNIYRYTVEPSPHSFLLLKSYFDALKNNSLPTDNPYSIKNLARDILEEQKRRGYKLIKRSVWSKFSSLF